ncbi:MAG: type II toxin-antitoxin system VapC family toxin [Candidatus Hodarchaeales archaeon]
MKSVYLDTNVILAQWVPTDPFYESSKRICQAVEGSIIIGFFSGLGLAEVSSVVERQQQKFSNEINEKTRLSTEYHRRIVRIDNLKIIDIMSPYNIIISEKKYKLNVINWQVFDIAAKMRLKTLDNLHIATIILLNKIKGKNIDFFITGDKELLTKSYEVKKEYGFSIVSPEQFITLEGL